MQPSNEPLVSAIIPAYNASRFIGETLKSVSRQNYPHIEVIVVDDGSEDNTSEIAAAFPNVRYLRKSNGGQASARNMGMRFAQGEYFAFVDADDLWDYRKISLQVRILLESGRLWAYCDCDYCSESLETAFYSSGRAFGLWEGCILERLLTRNFISSPTPVVARKVFDKVGVFDEKRLMRNREDWDMWLRIAADHPVAVVPKVLAKYRLHASSETAAEPVTELLESSLNVLRQAEARLGRRVARLMPRARAAIYVQAGLSFLRVGADWQGRACFGKALRLRPSGLPVYGYWIGSFAGKKAWMAARELQRNLLRRKRAIAGYFSSKVHF